MFDKLKKINELRNLQNAIKKEHVEVARNGVKVTLDGTFDLIELELNPDLDIKTQEKMVRECFLEAKNKIQTIIAKNFAGNLF